MSNYFFKLKLNINGENICEKLSRLRFAFSQQYLFYRIIFWVFYDMKSVFIITL